MFSVQAVDLDLDSKLELLVTNHQGPRDLIVGALFYYKLDGNDFRNSKWTKYTIYNKFPVVIFGNIYIQNFDKLLDQNLIIKSIRY